MSMGIKVALGADEYVIAFSPTVAVTGKDEATASRIRSAVLRARSEYSPSYGGEAAFVGQELLEQIGVKIVNVADAESVPGAVY